MASSLAPTGPNLDPTFLPVYSATAPSYTGITSDKDKGPDLHDPDFVEIKTTPSAADQLVSPTTLETSGEGHDLSSVERQKIIRDILSLPSSWAGAEESKSSHRGNTLDHLDLVYTLGSVYFTFHIYRSVHSQGFQTESNTSQERPMIKRVERSTPEQWEMQKKLLKQSITSTVWKSLC
jgi:hypothetical protein